MRARAAAAGLLALALAATPAYTVRFHLGPLPTTLLEVLLLAAIVAGVAATGGRLPWRNPYTWPALLLLAAATLGVAASPVRAEALGEWRAFFVEPMAAGLVAAALAVDGRLARLLLLGLAISGVVAAVADLALVVPHLSAHTLDVANPPVAIYQNANQLALYLVPLQALALALALFGQGAGDRVGAAAFLVLTVPAVVLSYSRGGIAALAVAVLVVTLLHPRRRRVALPLAAALAVAVALVPGIRRRVAVELDPASPDNTLRARLDLWRGTLRMLEHQPVLGAGLRGFEQRLRPYYSDPFKVAFPHDIALNFWSETGVAGLVAFTWISAAAVVAGARSLAAEPLARALGAGLIGFVAAVWVHGAVDVPYFKNDLALVFWAVLGLQAGAARVRSGAHGRE